MQKPSRNAPCPCGSGKKSKHCCADLPPRAEPAPASIELALTHHRAGRLAQAEAVYLEILAHAPAHPDALQLLGLVAHQRGEHEAARQLIQRALEINPRMANACNNLGEACRELGRFDEALAAYRQALALAPGLVEPQRNVALTLLALRRADEALSVLQHALTGHPAHPGLAWAQSQAYASLRQPERALAALDNGLAHSPEDDTLLCAKGSLLGQIGRPDDAIAYSMATLARRPELAAMHYNLALLHQKRGELDAASACLERYLALKPGDASAGHLLAALRQTTPEHAPAEYVREVFDYYADNFDTHLVSKLGYHTPELLVDLLAPVLPARPLRVLDLGCGTGLFGAAFKAPLRHLAGIDLSPRMIARARERGLYDELIVGDLLTLLDETPARSFDLLAAADVFNYVGKLDPVFEAAARVLEPGGWLAFSIETATTPDAAYTLDVTGRYRHAPERVVELAARTGFAVCARNDPTLRYEKDQPVSGVLFVFQLLAGSAASSSA